LAYGYNQEANYAAAVDAARTSLEYDADHVPSRVVLGEAYEGLGNIDQAIEQYRMAKGDLMWEQYVDERIRRLTEADEDTEGD
jgi:tetratricopeptide (TPR) repeat protein